MSYRILTICTGNICRSPMAEVVLAKKLAEVGLDVEVESAAVTTEALGHAIDHRAARTLRGAGYQVPDRRARQVNAEDFESFDLMLPMTRSHARALERFAERFGTGDLGADIRLFRDFVPDDEADVPDPWYGDQSDFDETLEIIEQAVPEIAEFVRENS
ncbi:MAG: low molecular weight protein-tyrosine-phosphatase [Scrofimicrobium sp.]